MVPIGTGQNYKPPKLQLYSFLMKKLRYLLFMVGINDLSFRKWNIHYRIFLFQEVLPIFFLCQIEYFHLQTGKEAPVNV